MQRYCSSQHRLGVNAADDLPVTPSLVIPPHRPGLQSSDSAVLARTGDASRPLLAPLTKRGSSQPPSNQRGRCPRSRPSLAGLGSFWGLGKSWGSCGRGPWGVHLDDHVFFWDSSLSKTILRAFRAEFLTNSHSQVYLVIPLNSSCPAPCNLVPLGPRQ